MRVKLQAFVKTGGWGSFPSHPVDPKGPLLISDSA
jgi:hypothetical protein